MSIALHITVFVVFLIFSLPVISTGKIIDGIACSECHTMHASQNDMPMGDDTPRESLLLLSCLGCHTGDNPDSSGRSAPFVLSASAPEYNLTGTENNVTTLAGGTFYWAYNDTLSGNKGHNVQPGREPSSTNPPGGDDRTEQLTCAGTNGCHGDPGVDNQYKALTKSHHKDDTTVDGTSIGTSYRFLSGVVGLEDPDWELPFAGDGLSSTKHNQYRGSKYWNSTDTDTITSVCVRCHGDFHGTDNVDSGSGAGSSPWLRHPTDIPLPGVGTEFESYATYDPVAPVASTSTLSVISDISTSEDNRLVTCISCHRAHGSRWPHNLRWNYVDWPNGTNTFDGCGICHSNKR